VGRAEALARRPGSYIEPYSRYDMVFAGAGAIGDLIVGFFANRFKATYVDGAEGDDLTILAEDHFSIVRLPATRATGQVTFTRGSPGGGTYSIASGSVVATQKDAAGREVRFVTTAPAAWGAGVGGDITVTAEAEDAGTVGNVGVGKITRIITAQTETITVTNSGLFVGGSASETDPELRTRIREYHRTLRRGTFAALEYGAKLVSGCKNATAVEDSTGRVTVYITDADGASNGTLVSAVAAELENWRACGALVTVVGGALLSVDINVTLTLRAGANVAQLLTAVQAAVQTRLSLMRIGETVYRTAISQAIRNIDQLNIVEAHVTMRTGSNPYAQVDIAPAANQIPRAGSISVS
jgi:uncharacterized phage protein gp47/JayE